VVPAASSTPPRYQKVLDTPSFNISITENCPEGDVNCQDVTYLGRDKKTGNTISLKGVALVRMCADGVTPCQHLGYEFDNGSYKYTITDDGLLTVASGARTLVSQQGQWVKG
jgi:hypothetical protein